MSTTTRLCASSGRSAMHRSSSGSTGSRSLSVTNTHSRRPPGTCEELDLSWEHYCKQLYSGPSAFPALDRPPLHKLTILLAQNGCQAGRRVLPDPSQRDHHAHGSRWFLRLGNETAMHRLPWALSPSGPDMLASQPAHLEIRHPPRPAHATQLLVPVLGRHHPQESEQNAWNAAVQDDPVRRRKGEEVDRPRRTGGDPRQGARHLRARALRCVHAPPSHSTRTTNLCGEAELRLLDRGARRPRRDPCAAPS